MVKNKKIGQVGVEYIILIGFVTLAIMAVLTLAYIYSGIMKDQLRLNQVENFATQLVNSVEAVFFAGEPSKNTVRLYLPDGVEVIEIIDDNFVMSTRTTSGLNKRAYKSRVPIQGTISSGEGLRKIILEAKEDYVLIS